MKVLSLSQVANDTGLSRQRVHQLAAAGILRTVEVMGRKAVKASELERFKKLERPAHRPAVKASQNARQL